jgi:hypothetical protein
VAQQREALAAAQRQSADAETSALARGLEVARQAAAEAHAAELDARRRAWTEELARALVRQARDGPS